MSLEILLIINVVIIVLGYIGYMKLEREVDRNVKHYQTFGNVWRMTCVLYDNEPRG